MMMDRSVVKKASLKDADDVFCLSQTTDERLAVLAELNRVSLVALGIQDKPLQRTETRRLTFREFSSRHSPAAI